MLDTEDLAHIIIITILEASAVLANITVIAAIRFRTPKDLSPYAVVVFSMACLDLSAAFASWMCTTRVHDHNFSMVIIYIGPCTLIGARVCHALQCLHIFAVSQSVVFLLISFSYRLWIFKRSVAAAIDHDKMKRQMRLICGLSALPLAVNTVTMATSAGSFPYIPEFSSYTTSVFNLTGSFPSTDHLAARVTVFTIFSVFGIGFGASFILRSRLLRIIAKLIRWPSPTTGCGSLTFHKLLTNSAPSDGHRHISILRSLSIQIALPITYVFVTLSWLLDVLHVVDSTRARRATLVVTSLFTLITPLANLYYLQPYRKYCMELAGLCDDAGVAPCDATSVSHTMTQFALIECK